MAPFLTYINKKGKKKKKDFQLPLYEEAYIPLEPKKDKKDKEDKEDSIIVIELF